MDVCFVAISNAESFRLLRANIVLGLLHLRFSSSVCKINEFGPFFFVYSPLSKIDCKPQEKKSAGILDRVIDLAF